MLVEIVRLFVKPVRLQQSKAAFWCYGDFIFKTEKRVEDQVHASGGGQSGGFPGHSLSKAYGTLGITGPSRKKTHQQ